MYTNPGPYTTRARWRLAVRAAPARKPRYRTHGTTSRAQCTACAELEPQLLAHTTDALGRHSTARLDSRNTSSAQTARRDRARALVDRGPAGPAATRRGARHARLLALRAGGQRRRPCCQLRLQVAPARKEGHSRPAEGKGDRDGEPSHAKGARSAAAHLAIPISRVLLVRGARHAGGAAVLSAQHGAHT